MQIEKDNEIGKESNDWAVLPFDEAEDDARWKKLIEETEQLIEDAAQMKADYGELLTGNALSQVKIQRNESNDDPF